MKRNNIIYAAIAIAASLILASCDSSDMPLQHPDSYNFITFGVQAHKLTVRTNPYEAYDPQRHPETMGVFGYYDLPSYQLPSAKAATATPANPNPVYSNHAVTYDVESCTWTCSVLRRWDDYRGATSFDFFAYMPKTDGAQVERIDEDTYCLSVPVTLSMSNEASPLIYDQRQAPIICALPEHRQASAAGHAFTFDRVIHLRFDQTLTAYNLQFRLDAKMSAIRHFRIKSVTLSGSLATGGTVTRTYQWKDGSWTAGQIQWTGLQRKTFTSTNPMPIPYKDTEQQGADNATHTIVVNADRYITWGDTFYVMPDKEFHPTISVTYDTEFIDQQGNNIVTRQNITSTIELSQKAFGNITAGTTATINPIRILIQPRYLYVMADQDAYAGYLLID